MVSSTFSIFESSSSKTTNKPLRHKGPVRRKVDNYEELIDRKTSLREAQKTLRDMHKTLVKDIVASENGAVSKSV
ncbi:hypothetical protein BC938DRAFT_482834 [Jimgerdemannia flammicorona]|uniref:Uncharacterized protein n=1 Tax=Jimgerdemannia flammicorona TaxID=994334 RepID=A0A433QD85_9FUNG|nr:hypothetical protein BC938DRAFT_482834 [Jimgerdemannia flammicorona]